MAKNVIMVHGAYAGPKDNWFPWLKSELEALNYNVSAPKFPTPEGQSLASWLKVVGNYNYYLDSKAALVGHSIGCALVLSKLEILKRPINSAFLVSGFIENIGIEKFDSVNSSFYENQFDWQRIRENCRNFFLYHSNNDPFVPLEAAERIARKLDIEIKIVKGAGHFLEPTFPDLLEDIKKAPTKP